MKKLLVFIGVLSAVTLISCKREFKIEAGKTVQVNYTLTVDGKMVDSSNVSGSPLTYIAGSGQIIPGLDEALMGLKKGEKKQVTVAPEKGYGPVNPNALQKIPKKQFSDPKILKVGERVSGNSGGRPVQATIVAIGKTDVTMDFNHPLAGKTLNFDIEVVDVSNEAPPAPVPAAPN